MDSIVSSEFTDRPESRIGGTYYRFVVIVFLLWWREALRWKTRFFFCSLPPPANFHCKPSVLMVDELLSAYPHQLTFSEAGMRIMITSHFSPRTRLAMASRMLINEVGQQRKLHVDSRLSDPLGSVLSSSSYCGYSQCARSEWMRSREWSFSFGRERQHSFHCLLESKASTWMKLMKPNKLMTITKKLHKTTETHVVVFCFF